MRHYPMARPYLAGREEKYIREVLKSGIFALGPKKRAFENTFARTIGTRYACAVSSGTAGLHLALLAAGIGPGDEVITSPFSFVSTANAVRFLGAHPVFADIEPVTYNLDPTKVSQAVSSKTKAILVVHVFGQAADMAPIARLARAKKLKIIEDACESISASYRGKKVGTFGESAVFSFYPNKQITTGEGGMIVTNKRAHHELFLSLRNQGRSPDMRWLDHNRLGYNYRMDEFSAAVGLAQLEKLGMLLRERRRLARFYDEALSPYDELIQRPVTASGNTHSWFVYVVRLRHPNIDRNKIIAALGKKGVGAKPYFPSIHLFDFYRKEYGYRKGDFPVSEAVSDSAVALPFYIGLTRQDICYIVRALLNAIRDQKSI